MHARVKSGNAIGVIIKSMQTSVAQGMITIDSIWRDELRRAINSSGVVFLPVGVPDTQ